MLRAFLIWFALIVALAPAGASERPFIILPYTTPLTAEQQRALHLVEQDPQTLAVEIIRFKPGAPEEALKRPDILPLGGSLFALVSRQKLASRAPSGGGDIDASDEDFYDTLSEEQVATEKTFFESERAAHRAFVESLHRQGILPSSSVPSLTWGKGARITVAFDGGSPSLHGEVVRHASEWSAKGDLSFDFGYNEQTKKYRSWSTTNPSNAQIRITIRYEKRFSFNSAVGKLSWCAARKDDAFKKACKKADQESMHLEAPWLADDPSGWDEKTKTKFQRSVVHEFGHALGFKHEHARKTCETEYVWADNPKWVCDAERTGRAYNEGGETIAPGLYQFMKCKNGWGKPTTNHNIKETYPLNEGLRMSDHDRWSVMAYRFPNYLYKLGEQSKCYVSRLNVHLSQMDELGLLREYPKPVGFVNFSITNADTHPVYVRFRNNPTERASRIWPAPNEYYLLDSGKSSTYRLRCIAGEHVCWGAWRKNGRAWKWGQGRDGDPKSASCVRCPELRIGNISKTLERGEE